MPSTRQQAHEARLSDDQLRRRVQSGILDQVGPHSFRSALAPRSELGDLTALVLDVGEPVWVSGPSAAALHGFDGFRLKKPYHLTLERGRNVRRIGVIVHTTTVLPLIDRARAQDVPVTSAARTIIDLARSKSPDALARALDSAFARWPAQRGALASPGLRAPPIAVATGFRSCSTSSRAVKSPVEVTAGSSVTSCRCWQQPGLPPARRRNRS